MNPIMLTIRSQMPKLTIREREIAKYVLKEPNHIMNLTIANLARLVDVSEATIVRFCKKIGFDGYSHFKLFIAQTYSEPSENLLTPPNPSGPEQISQSLLNHALLALKDTTALLDFGSLLSVASSIAQAPHVVICGVGGSAACGEMAKQRLLRLGVNVQVCSESTIMPLIAATLHEGDVGIGVSHRGNTEAVAEFLEICGRLSVCSVALTTNDKSLVGCAAKTVFQYVCSDTSLGPEAGDARIAQVHVLDVLCSTVAHIMQEKPSKGGDRS